MNEHELDSAGETEQRDAWTTPSVETLSIRDVYAVLDTQACGAPSSTNEPDCNAT